MVATEWELKNLTGIIYLWTCKINGKRYIGASKNTFYDRYGRHPKWWHHQASNKHFKRAIIKHGVEGFDIEILEFNQHVSALNCLESYYINKYKSDDPNYGYNKTLGGKNYVRSKEFNEKMGRLLKYTLSEVIEKCKTVHGDKFDYSKVEYSHSHTKVTITCKTCETEYKTKIWHHLTSKKGACPTCKLNYVSFEEFLSKAKDRFGDEFEYYPTYPFRTNKRIRILHKICGRERFVIGGSHLKLKYGCSYCADKNYTAKDQIPVVKLNDNGEILELFSSLAQAGRTVSSTSCNIGHACRTGQRCKGFRWKMISKDEFTYLS